MGVFVIVALFLVCFPVVLALFFAWLRKMNSPEKAFKNCLINVALTPMRMLKMGPFKYGRLSIDGACKYAIKKTGLSDFGDAEFLNSYKTMMNTSVYRSQKLTNIGYISVRVELQMTMVRRLKFIQYLKTNPDVLNVPVRSPVFVMGLPRTGTTFLHRLLSLDPACRSPLLWELLAPVPSVSGDAPSAEMKADLDSRARFVRKLVASRRDLGDHALEHIHEVGADLPEECLMALTDDLPILLHQLYTDYMSIKEYFECITNAKAADAYKHYRKYLQLLSYEMNERTNDARRWVLKCPIHLFYIKAIAQAFPDAKLVWTHRHPKSAVPSLCSLLKALHQIYYENECRDDAALGAAIDDVSAATLNQAPRDIEESGLECSHISYNQLIKDPVSVVKSIYKQYNWEFTEEYQKILENYLVEDAKKRDEVKQKKSKDALHTYAPEEFGLTESRLSDNRYSQYIQNFCK